MLAPNVAEENSYYGQKAPARACNEGAEPEPAPGPPPRTPFPAARSTAVVSEQLGRELAAYWQLCQLAAELASLSSPCAPAAPYFLQVADSVRLEAGGLIDLLIRQGEAVELPSLDRPLAGLAQDSGKTSSLEAALESTIQLLDATNRHDFCEATRRGDAEVRRQAEQLYIAHRHLRGSLYRHLTTLTALRGEAGAVLQYARLLADQARAPPS